MADLQTKMFDPPNRTQLFCFYMFSTKSTCIRGWRPGTDLRRGRFLVETFTKMKELGPVGGGAPGAPPGSVSEKALWTPVLHPQVLTSQSGARSGVEIRFACGNIVCSYSIYLICQPVKCSEQNMPGSKFCNNLPF